MTYITAHCRGRSRWAASAAGLLALLLVGGCASWFAADADREVRTILAEYESRTLGDRAQRIRQPKPAPDEVEDTATSDRPTTTMPADSTADSPDALVIDLPTALAIAFEGSRQFQQEQESLYLEGLGFSLTRYNFGPILNSTISYLWSDAEDQVGSDSHSADLGVSQILPLGGELSASGEIGGDRTQNYAPFEVRDEHFDFASSAQVNLRQPLLRGLGYEVSHEQLTQGKRDLIYAVRSFELFREDLAISIAESYYNLVSSKRRLANDEQNYRDAVFDRKKAEALRQVDRNKDDDVFLAQRREIEAEDALLVARTDYDLAVDDFKIQLGMPTTRTVQIIDDDPPFSPVRIDPASAVLVSQYNRLDLHTLRDRVEDAERAVRIARHNLLPDLDLAADAKFDSEVGDLDQADPQFWSASIGVTLEVPLDRKAERNAYRASLITLARTRRSLEERLDEIRRDILDQLRELQQLEKRIELQEKQVIFEQRAVAVTKLRYEAGNVDNRDLLDARQGLTNAQNALIDLKVRHFVARLRLRRNLGVMFVDEKGMWAE
ncbi:MAG: TolC family protein [Phycisphaerae bacterium]|nr:TolC family protein [Phycisphaerae bacterium]